MEKQQRKKKFSNEKNLNKTINLDYCMYHCNVIICVDVFEWKLVA